MPCLRVLSTLVWLGAFLVFLIAGPAVAAPTGSLFNPNDYASLGDLVVPADWSVLFSTDLPEYCLIDPTGTSGAWTSASSAQSESGNALVALFCFDRIDIQAGATVIITTVPEYYPPMPLVLLSKTDATVAADFDMVGGGGGAGGVSVYDEFLGEWMQGPGGGGSEGAMGGAGGTAGCGGGYGGEGGGWAGGETYGDDRLTDLYFGSGGAGGDSCVGMAGSVGGDGGDAGGAIGIIALDHLTVSGEFLVDGRDGSYGDGSGQQGGGGSGGAVLLAANTLDVTGLDIDAGGGDGTGGGGGGRVAFYADSLIGLDPVNVDVEGGDGGLIEWDGQDGTFRYFGDGGAGDMSFPYPVPEPATFSLLVLGGLALIRRRRVA